MDDRKEFLTKVYDQMFNDIERHHKIVWQTISVLVGAFAILALVEKKIMPIDTASSLIILLISWVLAHVYDSNYWYNRNLVIIANIERQFLKKEDLREIHYYFGKHRDENSVQTSLKIQKYFCWAVAIIFLFYHFSESIYPGFDLELKLENIKFIKILPYISVVCGLIFVKWIKKKRINDYKEFIKNSPGVEVDSSEITFGTGHPITKN